MNHKIQSRLKKFFFYQFKFLSTYRNLIDVRILDHAALKSYSKVLNRRGYQPTLALEKGILERTKIAGLSHLVAQNLDKKITTNRLRQSVIKSRKAVTAVAKSNIDFSRLFNATASVIKNCRFPKNKKFHPLNANVAFDISINKAASSGYPHFKPKGLLKGQILDEYFSYFTVDPMTELYKYPTTTSFRAQLRNSEGIDVKLRLMYPITGVITLMESTFVYPFVRHFSTVDTFYSIGRTGGQIGQILKNNFHYKNKIISLDVESFDQHMLNEVIICAFFVLRQQLTLNLIQERIFKAVMHYFMQSIVGYKLGKQSPQFYVKHHGIPSGSGFTNLIGTLCHAIIIEYLEPGLLNRNAQICSDDNIFSYSKNEKDLFEQYKSVFALTISKNKTFITYKSNELSYLGFKWINFERHIDVKLTINQCIWHTEYRSDLDLFDREVARCASTLLNGKNGASIFSRLFPDVTHMLRKRYDIKFIYLRSGRPPLKLIEFTPSDKLSTSGELKSSLRHHMKFGYLIR